MTNYFLKSSILLTAIFLLFLSCQKEDEATNIQLTISPSAITLNTTASYQFIVSISGTDNQEVVWNVKEGVSGGTISPSGLYKAPATPGTYEVEVISKADNARKANAVITVSEIPVIAVNVTPNSTSTTTGGKIQFSASVTNTTNTTINWSIKEGAAGGSITSSGLYTAPSTAGLFHVVVASQADPSKIASAAISVTTPIVSNNPEKEISLKHYRDLYVGSALTDIGWTGNTTNCNPGTTPQTTKDKVLKRIMYYRTMVGLKNPVNLNDVKSSKCQQTALMCKANAALNHNPPTTWLCYTAEGKEAAGKSNLASGNSGPNAVSAYIRDDGSNNYFVGHRRWLLFPKLKEVGTGDTNSTNALWVIGDTGSTPTDMPEFIAWPPKGYIPATVVYSRWSFSIPNADFTNTTISMNDPSGNNMAITMENLNNGGYGDRTIVWKPQGVVLSSTDDLTYKVSVNNVKVGTVIKNFQYDVIIFKP